MPLNEISAAHKCTVLGSPAVVVPQVEVDEVNAVGERRTFENSIGAQAVHNRFGLSHTLVRNVDYLFGLLVHTVDDRLCMALRADLLHVVLREKVVWPFLGNCVREVVGQAFGGVVRHLVAIDAAHMAGCTCWDPHVVRSEHLWRLGEIQQPRLCVEQNTMLRFFVYFDLRVVWTHMTLTAGARLAGNRYRTRMPRVAGGTRADGPIVIWPADAVTLIATARHGRCPFERGEWMRRALGVSRMVLLSEVGLFGRDPAFPIDCRPRNRGVTAAEEFLIDGLVAPAAIRGRQVLGDHESVVVIPFLISCRLMALQTTHVLLRMHAHLVFVNNAVLQPVMALRAFSRCADQRRIGLRGLRTGPGPVYQKSADRQRKTQDNGNEDSAKSCHHSEVYCI